MSLGIDGCTRMITHLRIADNNEALTTFQSFMIGVEEYGLPDRIRTDHGGENLLIIKLMLRMRGYDRKSVITGKFIIIIIIIIILFFLNIIYYLIIYYIYYYLFFFVIAIFIFIISIIIVIIIVIFR